MIISAFLILSLLYKSDLKLDWKADAKSITNRSCLISNSSCFSTKQSKIWNGVNKTHHFDVRDPCIFPFKHYNKIYNNCIRGLFRPEPKRFACATSVDADLEWKTSAFCNEKCPTGMYFHSADCVP